MNENAIKTIDLTKKSGDIVVEYHLLNPTSGFALVNGYDIVKQRDDVRNSILIIFQHFCIDTQLTGRKNLDFHARMYHKDKGNRDRQISEVLELLDLKGMENTIIKDFSKKIAQFDGIKNVKELNSSITLKVKNTEEAIPDIVEFADGNNFKISFIEMHKQSLEDVFLYYVGRTLGGMTTIFMLLICITFNGFGLILASLMNDMEGFSVIMNPAIFPIFFRQAPFPRYKVCRASGFSGRHDS